MEEVSVSTECTHCLLSRDKKHVLERVNSVIDLGVTFDSHLLFSEHINDKINQADIVLGLIKRNFHVFV